MDMALSFKCQSIATTTLPKRKAYKMLSATTIIRTLRVQGEKENLNIKQEKKIVNGGTSKIDQAIGANRNSVTSSGPLNSQAHITQANLLRIHIPQT